MAEREEVDWKGFVRNAVDLAAQDPVQFRSEMKAIGRRFGLTVEEVYARLRADPEVSRKLAALGVDQAIQRGAKRLQEELRKFGL